MMDLSSLTIKDLIEFLHTPTGRLVAQGVLVFIGGEVVRLFSIQLLDGMTKMPFKKIKILSELSGYVANILFSIMSATILFFFDGWYKIIVSSWWIIMLSLVAHFLYVTWLKKQIDKKMKGSK